MVFKEIYFDNNSAPGKNFLSGASSVRTLLRGETNMSILSMWEETPAHEFWDAHVMGNGHLGMSVYGTIPKDEILINSDTLWSGCENFYVNPKHYVKFCEAQKAALEGRVKEANNIINDEMTGRWTESYMPLGMVYLMHGQKNNIRNMELKKL